MDIASTKKVAQGVAWASAASWGCQLLSFAIYTGLARLLTPEAFGLVAIAGVYIAFIQVLVAQGFGMAIIQRTQLDDEHLDSAFWIAMTTAFLFCLLSYLFGAQIARLFGEPRIAAVIEWLSFSLFFYGMSSVQIAILTRQMNFRALAIRSLFATAIAGAVGLGMAFFGWGVWSLVGQQLVYAILGSVFMWWSVSWRPGIRISRRHLGDLYKFSLNLTGNDLLWFFSQKSDQTMVGYGFGSLGLGPYSLASRLPTLLHDGIIGPLQSVAFPTFSRLQSEPLRFERALLKFCEMSTLICFPVFAGIAAIAPSLVPWLFGAKWLAAIPLLQILAAYGAVRSVLGFMHPLMLSKGRAGLYLFMNIILAALTLAGCLVAVRWNPRAIALSVVLTMSLFAVVFLLIARRPLELKIRPLVKTLVFPGVTSLFMFIVVALVQRSTSMIFTPGTSVFVCVIAGVLVYCLTAYYGRPDLVRAIWEMVASHVLSSDRADRFNSTPVSAELNAAPVPAEYVAKATPDSSEP
jgi:O-antigen/teichoic acid export membrane protein